MLYQHTIPKTTRGMSTGARCFNNGVFAVIPICSLLSSFVSYGWNSYYAVYSVELFYTIDEYAKMQLQIIQHLEHSLYL